MRMTLLRVSNLRGLFTLSSVDARCELASRNPEAGHRLLQAVFHALYRLL